MIMEVEAALKLTANFDDVTLCYLLEVSGLQILS